MADLSTETVPDTGLDPTQNSATAAGDTFEYGSIVRVVNGGASPITVTMVTPGTEADDLAIDDREVSVPDGEFRYIKADDRVYRDPETNLVTLTYDDDTSVTVEVIK